MGLQPLATHCGGKANRPVWHLCMGTALNKKSYLNILMKVQRQAELCISGALKTTI